MFYFNNYNNHNEFEELYLGLNVWYDNGKNYVYAGLFHQKPDTFS